MSGIVNTGNVDYFNSMARDERYPHKRQLQLDTELKEALENYRFAERFNHEAEAIRALMRKALGLPPEDSSQAGKGKAKP